ncbi:hypothetical protein CC99x_001475 [Candidatus Berkiella cookevillensis]|uniref:Uncharacterized protein n=1 Tax=Candidatus Berkiella cookevillensis TaxID=437022 RepID=A0A0Q9YPJ1_9GAMM|nr:hypothetical protein [Candidatus Berkiella cookevillensis]MCS5707567.1 hypothetical protein [Candidatus Berkiella cookevillensis]
MSHITKQNFLALIIAGISAGSTPRDIHSNILSKAEELGLETNTEGFENFVAELTDDYIVPLRNAVAGKLGLSKLNATLEMLFSSASIDEKELTQKLSSYAKNQNLPLDEALMNELIALQQFAHPTLLTEFFPAFLDFDLSSVEDTDRKKSNAIISLAKNFGLKINSSIAKDLLSLKDLFEKNEHFPVLKEIIKNLLSANISEVSLKAVLTEEARRMGYDFQESHINQLVQLKKDYALLLNGPEATPGKNIITTAMFASAMLYQFPGMVSHMLAFQTINTGLKKVIGAKWASWLPLTGLFASMIGYPLPHSTYINMLNNFIYGMIQEHPTAAFLVLVPASVLYYRFDDVRALYHKGKAFASDPLGFEAMFSDALGDAFSSFTSETSVSESAPQILVFPKKATITTSSTEDDSSITPELSQSMGTTRATKSALGI